MTATLFSGHDHRCAESAILGACEQERGHCARWSGPMLGVDRCPNDFNGVWRHRARQAVVLRSSAFMGASCGADSGGAVCSPPVRQSAMRAPGSLVPWDADREHGGQGRERAPAPRRTHRRCRAHGATGHGDSHRVRDQAVLDPGSCRGVQGDRGDDSSDRERRDMDSRSRAAARAGGDRDARQDTSREGTDQGEAISGLAARSLLELRGTRTLQASLSATRCCVRLPGREVVHAPTARAGAAHDPGRNRRPVRGGASNRGPRRPKKRDLSQDGTRRRATMGAES